MYIWTHDLSAFLQIRRSIPHANYKRETVPLNSQGEGALKSTVPIVLSQDYLHAIEFALASVVMIDTLFLVNANPSVSMPTLTTELPLAIAGAAVLSLAIVGTVIATKLGLIKIHKSEAKTITASTETSNDTPLIVRPLWFCRYCGADIAFSGQYCDKCGSCLNLHAPLHCDIATTCSSNGSVP